MKKLLLGASAIAITIIGIVACNKRNEPTMNPGTSGQSSFVESFNAKNHQFMVLLQTNSGAAHRDDTDPTNTNNPYDQSGAAHNKQLDYIGANLATVQNPETTLYMPEINNNGETISVACSTVPNKLLYYSEEFFKANRTGVMPKDGVISGLATTLDWLKNHNMGDNLADLVTQGVISQKVSDIVSSYYKDVKNVTDAAAIIQYSINFENSVVAASTESISDNDKMLILQYATIYKYSTFYWLVDRANNSSNPWKNVNLPVGGGEMNWDALGTYWGYLWCINHTGPGGFGNNDYCNCHGNPYCVSNVWGALASANAPFI